MASRTIGTILTLKDQMSPKLFRVSKNVGTMSKEMQRAAKQSVNMANRFTNGVNKMVSKAAHLAKVGVGMVAAASGAGAIALVKQSDTYASIQARLKLINDGQQTVAQFNEKIFVSADRARVKYEDVAGAVGKLGILAGNAFKNNDEILKFSELMSKSFKIGGASVEEQSAAMYQLTQAMAAGKLQGDEFRSILENAPMLAQAIAKEMNLPLGKLKELSSEGKITSDIIKQAMFNSADEINKQFSEMPMTFAEAVTKIKNGLTQKLQPTFKKLSGWLNSDAGTAAINKIGDGINTLVGKIPAIAKVLESVFKTAKKIFNFIVKYQDVIIFIGTFIITVSALSSAFIALGKTIKALKVIAAATGGVLKLSTFGAVGIAIAALIAIGVLLWKNWDSIKEKAKPLIDKLAAIKDKIIELKDKFIDFKDSAIKVIKGKLEGFKQTLEDNQAAIKTTATVLGVIFGPALIGTGTKAAIAGGKIAAHFIASIVKTGTEAVVSGAKLTASFIASIAKAGATAVVSAAKITVSFVASLIKTSIQGVATAAVITGQLIVAMVKYALSGWRAVAAIGATAIAWAAQKIAMLASTAVTYGMTAAQWALNAAMSANPVGLVIIGIAALIAAGILLWKNWDTVKGKASELWGAISGAFGGIRDAIVGAFNSAREKVSGFFNWIGEKIRSIPGIDLLLGGNNLDGESGGRLGRNALGTSYWRGGPTHINERGGEIIDLPNGSRVIPADKSQRIMNSRSVSVGNINIYAKGVTSAEVMNEVVPQLKLALANM